MAGLSQLFPVDAIGPSRNAQRTSVIGSLEQVGAASRHRVLPLSGRHGLVTDVAGDVETPATVGAVGVEVVRAQLPHRAGPRSRAGSQR